ncbi:hypothetical protein PUNSTDRAFT_41198 [Punctularia strigosozonata HHB-11173 SS5]|uniref:uncharacterized protein n=1 Tax=Punctularia strigosozonata (strain HHB-11173) TaxID=741275 RepID=UPI0004416561|nr:uncharacterized protein PUNSTDRAFT_41198 [Punctularia strigosozonata HHB-11173 SS5]EIN13718.1 hypothetical protein PUNSTDRAFT_41198 [Punctularia strigosozonata HHB-11173 SS5]
MAPVPILPHTVALVLQYIAPPSQLDQPLPKHLISRLLLNRHEFLGIYPTNPPEYLCWSADGRDAAIDALEHIQKPEVDAAPPDYPVQYEIDEENVSAYVRMPGSDLRLTFVWDDEDGWTFHDIRLAGFPPRSTPSLQEALSRAAEPEPVVSSQTSYSFLSAQHRRSSGPANHSSGTDHEDDGSYWDAYGAQSDDENGTRSRGGRSTKSGADGTEDAYWASYSSIHGTADSTIPSPLPAHRRQQVYGAHAHGYDPSSDPYTQDVQAANGPGRVAIPRSAFPGKGYVEGEPPSPHTLSNLLSSIPDDLVGSRRAVPVWTPSPQSRSSEAPKTPSDPVGASVASESISSGASTPPTNPPMAEAGGVSLAYDRADGDFDFNAGSVDIVSARVSGVKESEADVALKHSIAGLYRLWKGGRSPGAGLYEDDSAVFLRLVREAVTD